MRKLLGYAIGVALTVTGPLSGTAQATGDDDGFPTGIVHRAGNADLQLIRLPEAEVAHPGITSSGVSIAIIDDGIDRTHEYFTRSDGSSRVVAESCFLARCPNGSDTQFGAGAATPALDLNGQPNSHGTLVAGAAAGKLHRTPVGDEPSRGVAGAADIVAIRVFPDDSDDSGARWSDVRRALEWVLDNAARYRIASVNMSFGSGAYGADCSGRYPELDALIVRLLAAGVTPVASTGNERRADVVMAPACIPGVVGVGSLDWAGTGVDTTSNSGPGTDLLAPGRGVVSSAAGGGGRDRYEAASGTSIAAPHVAGAVALLAATHPGSTTDRIVAALLAGSSGGIQGRTDLRKLDILGAANALAATAIPPSTPTGPPKPLTRLAGTDRYETAALASQHAYPDGADVVYLVSGLNFPDALIAGGVAAHRPGPVLLAGSTLPPAIAAEITRLQPASIVILGGSGVVADHVFDAARRAAPSAGITRLAGNDRYETAALAAYGFDDVATTRTVYLVSGLNFPDALIAGGVAAHRPGPVLLAGGRLAATIDSYLAALGDYEIVVLGGEAVVSAAAADAART